MTTSLFILVIVALIFGFTLYIFKLLRDDVRSLREGISSTKDTINSSLTNNTRDINDRLSRAAEVIGDLKKEAGAFSEVSRSMKSLQDFLQSPKLRGNIGEMVLKDLIGQMFPAHSFNLQYSFKSGVIVDAVIKTEAGLLPIDSKFPLENFQKIMSTTNKMEADLSRRAFMRDIKNHISSIAKKYILPEENTLDYALMYIPSESVFYEVASSPELMDFARVSRVYPVSPNTLYAALQTILLSFEGKKIESRAKEVFKLLRGVQKDLSKTSVLLTTLGSHLTNAYHKYSEVQSNFTQIEQKVISSHTLTESDQPRITP